MHTRNHSLVCRWVGISLDIIKKSLVEGVQKLHDTAGKKKREEKKMMIRRSNVFKIRTYGRS